MEQTDTVNMAVMDAIDAVCTLPPLQRVQALRVLREDAEREIATAIEAARDPQRSGLKDRWYHGDTPRAATWAEIGTALAVTKSAAHQRFSWVDAPEHLRDRHRGGKSQDG